MTTEKCNLCKKPFYILRMQPVDGKWFCSVCATKAKKQQEDMKRLAAWNSWAGRKQV